MSVRDLGSALGIHFAQVSKIGTGHRFPTRTMVEAWLDACHVTDRSARRDVEALHDAAATYTATWRREQRAGTVQHLVRSRLDTSQLVCAYQPAIVPGLLQSEEYARLIVTYYETLNPGLDVEATVTGRIATQSLLDDGGHRFVFVLGQRVLERGYGDEAMIARQRDLLRAAAERGNVTIAVLPDTEVSPTVPFRIYDEPTEGADAVVSVELPFGEHVVVDPDQVDDYRTLFARLRDTARPLA